jgi:H+-transporting ATPase
MGSSGMTTAAASEYQKAHGYNEIVERKDSLFRKILKRSLSPISAMLLVAALLSLLSGKAFDAFFIACLLVVNIAVTVWQEHKADTAIEKLNEHLSAPVKALRDGTWQTINARLLVPHDLVRLSAGGIVPADASVVEAQSLSANEAAISGESLPKDKKPGDGLYSGSFLASGFATIEVTATGSNTYFGKTLSKIDTSEKRSALEKDILRISRFLSIASVCAVIFLTAIFVAHHAAWTDILRLDLSLVIAGIPISLPTVMTLIIAFGVIELAKKKVIVRRLSSLGELANADLLLTDKTGTLTKNRVTVNEVSAYGSVPEEEARRLAALAARSAGESTINAALLEGQPAATADSIEVITSIPADSSRKRSTLTFKEGERTRTISVGAPQVVVSLCDMDAALKERFQKHIADLGERGYRALALSVAEGEAEAHMTLAAVFALSDELRDDAAAVVRFLGDNGIGVTMVTGDNHAIAREIADTLKIPGNRIVTRDELLARGWDHPADDLFTGTQAFAEILPEDKYQLVMLARKSHTVASNGDGVNDLPAVKAASVGFAVKNAVDALKAAADIVLLSDGIGVMRDAFIEGRKIFARLYAYSLYRISESFRLIVTIVLLGLVTGTYPLSPLQLILIALLNDIPVISLAFDRVRVAHRPSKRHVRQQFTLSILFGFVGIVNSMLLYFFATAYLHLPLAVVQTLFFLKLTVSGHLLIYVAHTSERWYRFLPSRQVIIATSVTQGIATLLALTGFLMPAPAPWPLILLVWVWSFFFMQIGELVKALYRPSAKPESVPALASAAVS